MKKNGINGKINNILQHIYKNSKCAVKINTKLTQFFQYEKGVIQGNPISPILFNIYINDLFSELEKCNKTPVTIDDKTNIHALMFADDLIIVSTTQKGLQDSLDKLCEYCRKWDLKVNLAKTKCVVFSRGRCKLDSKFVFDKKEVEYANSFKYLGVSIDHRGNFSPTMKDLSTKATNAIFALNSFPCPSQPLHYYYSQ